MARWGRRLLLYSHDTLGLGHLSRCRTIAHGLVRALDGGATALILTGSPMAGGFAYAPGVDVVRLPGIAKGADGRYRTRARPLALGETVSLRAALITRTVEAFAPDLVIVDKEPLGLNGELRPALDLLGKRGTPLVLGLRDVLDAPDALSREWTRKGAWPALARYEEIWAYGLKAVHDPLGDVALAPAVRERIVHTGYLPRQQCPPAIPAPFAGAPFLLVTTGGGADGAGLIDLVLTAYERAGDLPPALIVTGPFLPEAEADRIARRAARLPTVDMRRFEPDLGALMARAAGVIAMGGYNTFCEILTHDRPALMVPRLAPRAEQRRRAERAAALGLSDALIAAPGMIDPDDMAARLRALPDRPLPSRAGLPGLLDGLDSVAARARALLAADGLRAETG